MLSNTNRISFESDHWFHGQQTLADTPASLSDKQSVDSRFDLYYQIDFASPVRDRLDSFLSSPAGGY
jgi:hypothetical protein